jgi:hypothetical protein
MTERFIQAGVMTLITTHVPVAFILIIIIIIVVIIGMKDGLKT